MTIPSIAADGDDFQSIASAQGRSFEMAVQFQLRAEGWAIESTHAKVEGIEVDIVATDPNGVRWWIECKGSWRGSTPGSKRGDTVKKAVGVAAVLATFEQSCPYLLITSHLPKPGTVGALMLDVALRQGWFTQIKTMGLIAAPDPEEDTE